MKMKKYAMVMATTAMMATMAVPAMAAPAQLRSDFSIVVDGKDTDFKTSSGQAAYPILYKGSTYLPLRAIGELMGKNVNWDQSTKTIDISGSRTSTSSDKDNPNIGIKSIDVKERKDFIIKVDGNEKTFYAVTGQKVYPVLYDGITYLPLRSVGELMGKDVVWDGKNKVITLKGGGDVTDADTTTKPVTPPSINTQITEEEAKQIALQHAGLTASQVNFIKVKAEMENGKMVFDVEFYTDTKEFDYEIDPATGKILSYDYDVEGWEMNKPNKPDVKPNETINLEKAKQIALKHAGVAEKDAVFTKAEQDYDDGQVEFEIEFRVGVMEYEYEIYGNGNIKDFSVEKDD